MKKIIKNKKRKVSLVKAREKLRNFLISKSNKKNKYNALMGLLITIFIGIVIVLNLIVSTLINKYDFKLDLTFNELYKISNETKEFLNGYEKDVKLILLNDEQSFKKSDDVYAKHIYNICKNFASFSPHIFLEFVNLNEQPSFVSKFPNLALQQNGVLLVSEKENKAQFVSASTMFKNSYEMDSAANEMQVVSNVEKNIANTLEFLDGKNNVFTLTITGHNELDLKNIKNGFFGENGYDLKEFNLSASSIDEKAELILIVAPTIDYSEEEILKLKKFVDSGKNLVYFASALQPKLKNLEAFFLENGGFSFKEGVVVETDQNKMASTALNEIFTYANYENEYLKNMFNKKAPISLNDCKPIEIKESDEKFNVTKICETGETSTILLKNNNENFNIEKAEKKSFPLAVGVNKKISDEKKSKITVFSSAYILGGVEVPQFGNGEFVLSVLGATANHESKTKILPKIIGLPRLKMGLATENLFGLIFIFLLPFFVAVFGVVIFQKRRRR